jgi:phospholipid-binding lipoprotein MlaA
VRIKARMRLATTALLFLLVFLSTGCTRPPNGSPSKDPLEKINRPIYKFNSGFDTILLRPVAKGYQFITPRWFRVGVTNFYDNLNYPVTIVNSFLQGKFEQGLQDTGRFVFNSTLGIAGILDPATVVGMPLHSEDFGQTFSVWGIPQGPYIVLPLLGPSTITSGIGILANTQVSPIMQWPDSSVRSKLFIGWVIESRESFLSVDGAVRDSFDPYLFVRDAYLQNRQYLIHDGAPPGQGFDDEDVFGDEFDEGGFDEAPNSIETDAPPASPDASPEV